YLYRPPAGNALRAFVWADAAAGLNAALRSGQARDGDARGRLLDTPGPENVVAPANGPFLVVRQIQLQVLVGVAEPGIGQVVDGGHIGNLPCRVVGVRFQQAEGTVEAIAEDLVVVCHVTWQGADFGEIAFQLRVFVDGQIVHQRPGRGAGQIQI